MLILNKQARALSLIATAILGMTIASCSNNDDPAPERRSKEYTLKASGGATTGKVTVRELTDSTFTLTVRIDKSVKDTTYKFALYNGKMDATAPTVFKDLGTVKSQTTDAAIEVKWENVKNIPTGTGTETKKFNYDSLMKYQAFARVAFEKKNVTPVVDSVYAIGNIAASAQ